jgi:RNA ligase
MNYTFPEIRTINDVLPHIEGRSEFIVAEREFGTVVNYVVSMADTFNMTGPDDLGGAIRRELRGIIFDCGGNIMSRPFHKFFNVGEREETLPHHLDFSCDHTIMTKVDGSMLRPIMFEGKIRWGTKMGFSEVAEFAETYIAKYPQYAEFAAWCMSQALTPIFEYVGPFNKVVLDYDEGMTLLAVRENVSGKYLNIHGDI